MILVCGPEGPTNPNFITFTLSMTHYRLSRDSQRNCIRVLYLIQSVALDQYLDHVACYGLLFYEVPLTSVALSSD